MGAFLDLLEALVAVVQGSLTVAGGKAFHLLQLQELVIVHRDACRANQVVVVIVLGIVFTLQLRHLAVISQFTIQVSQRAVVAPAVGGRADALLVKGIEHVHRLVIHARLGALECQQQAALVGTDGVLHHLGKRDAPTDVMNRRITHVRMILLVQAVAQLILHLVVVRHSKCCLKFIDAVLALLNKPVGLLDGFIQFAVFLLQVNA